MSPSNFAPVQGETALRPRARLLAIIGRELIKDESVAVSELVKNSYDADASHVSVLMNGVASPETGTIEIRDNGHGMKKEHALRAWLEPATSFKREQIDEKSICGRVLLGEKGVGRFAVDKLGKEMVLVTRYAGENYETVVKINSEAYERDQYLDEIKNEWYTRLPEAFIDPPWGTVIKISKLRVSFSSQVVENIHQALSKLISPAIASKSDFVIDFKCSDYPRFTGRVEIPLTLSRAPWSIHGNVDEFGTFTYAIKDGPLQVSKLEKSSSKRFLARDPKCGPFKLTVYAWDKTPGELKKAGVDAVGNKYLRENFGVRVYRDDFRVLPYGDRDDDWLGLDARRVQNPTFCIDRNRILGWVEISRKENPHLTDKTNREGIIEEGESFGDLRELCVIALSLLEAYRYPLRPSAKTPEVPSSNVVVEFFRLEKMVSTDEARRAIRNARREYEAEADEWQERFSMLTELAGIGVTLEKVTHEFDKAVNVAKSNYSELLKLIEKPEMDRARISQIVKAVSEAIDVAEKQLELISPLYYPARGRKETLFLEQLARNAAYLFTNTFKSRGINYEVRLVGKQDITVKAERGDWVEVFVNLIDNALYWLETSSTPNPTIIVKIDAPQKRMVIADNGPGVAPQAVPNLFKPFFTTKPRGRGLGLYICKQILTEIDADILLMEKDRILPGANFMIVFGD